MNPSVADTKRYRLKHEATDEVNRILEPCGDIAYNSAVIIDGFGRIILRHRNIDEYIRFSRGSRFSFADTRYGRLGLLVCRDLYDD